MPFGAELSRLTEIVSSARSTKEALDSVVHGVLGGTVSDHVILAVLNEDLGQLEIIAGAGAGFNDSIIGQRFAMKAAPGEGIVGRVAATAIPSTTDDVRREPQYRALFPSTRSEVAVPVLDHEGRVRAVLNVESNQASHYREEMVNFIKAGAHLVSLVLRLNRGANRETALLEVGRSLGTAANETDLIQRVMVVAEQVLHLQACSIFLLDAGSQKFVLRSTTGNLRGRIGEISYEPGEGFTGWVGQTGRSIRLHSPQDDQRWRGKYVEFPNEEIASFLAVPILSREGCIGIIRVLRRKSEGSGLDNRFDEDDERLLEAIADQVATGLGYLRSIHRILRDERMVAWGELSAKSSHMIGNRVFALKGDVNELDYVLSNPSLDREGLRELHRGLALNLTRIEEILQDFRDFVTATQIHLEVTDLNELIRETVAEVFPRSSNVNLELDLSDALPQIPLDPRRLRRAVSELVENALQHMTHGNLKIQSSVSEGGQDCTERKGRWIRVDVSDDGPGVPEESKRTVFRPFFTTRVKGMGLGLSIVKGIVEEHGGAILEQGQSGHGAHFVILLPLESQ